MSDRWFAYSNLRMPSGEMATRENQHEGHPRYEYGCAMRWNEEPYWHAYFTGEPTVYWPRAIVDDFGVLVQVP